MRAEMGEAEAGDGKSEEVTRNIPVIFLTAKTDAEDETRGLEVGAVDGVGCVGAGGGFDGVGFRHD